MNENIEKRIERIEEKIAMRDKIALALISGIFSRESMKGLEANEKVTVADFIWDMADTILIRREVRRFEDAREALSTNNE